MKDNCPNIILITTDQQRFDTIAALGNKEIYTPHIDWLVDDGITFTRAYTDCPICMPARTTIINGQHAYTHGMTGNGGMKLAMKDCHSLPSLLTTAGYQTRAQGKMHFEPMRCNYGFEQMELPMDYYREQQRLGTNNQPKEHGVGENEITPVISTVHETESLTHWTVKRSIDFLETRDETRPFFLWTSFTKPHPPFDPCANYWALYSNREVSPPIHGDWSEQVENIPQGFMEPTYCLNNAYRMVETQLQDVKRAYYACITQIDYQLGLLFARMREMNMLENTWIIFTSDHGEMLGDHHMASKTIFLEGSSHIPMIIRPPVKSWTTHPLAGKKVDKLAQLVDIMPTILGIAGVEVPDEAEGVNLLELDDTPIERTFFGLCANNHFGVMHGKMKLCFTAIGGDELLFDLEKDPQEKCNLIADLAYSDKLSELRTDLKEKLMEFSPELIHDGEIVAKPGIKGAADVGKWPGFHSTKYPSDVLH